MGGGKITSQKKTKSIFNAVKEEQLLDEGQSKPEQRSDVMEALRWTLRKHSSDFQIKLDNAILGFFLKLDASRFQWIKMYISIKFI